MKIGVRRLGNKAWFKCSECKIEKEVQIRPEASDGKVEAQGEILLSMIGWKAYGDMLCPSCQKPKEEKKTDCPSTNDLLKLVQEACKAEEEKNETDNKKHISR